jgi:hypothetical protein
MPKRVQKAAKENWVSAVGGDGLHHSEVSHPGGKENLYAGGRRRPTDDGEDVEETILQGRERANQIHMHV